MRVERFKASSMREAMGTIQNKLGEDAVILHSRETDNGIEIIAAVEQSQKDHTEWFESTFRHEIKPDSSDGKQSGTSTEQNIPQLKKGPLDERDEKAEKESSDKSEKEDNNGHSKINNWDELIDSVDTPSETATSTPATMDEVSRRAIDFSQALKHEISEIEKQRVFWIKSEKRLEDLKMELAVLKQHLLSQELAEVKERAKILKNERLARKAKEANFNQEILIEKLLSQVEKRLLNRGISTEFAKEITIQFKAWIVRSNLNLTHKADLKNLKKGLVTELKKMIKVQPFAHLSNKNQNVVALVGPSGVGKSETALKMAINYQLAFRKKVAVIIASDGPTTDFKQMALLASIAKVSFSIVSGPMDLKETIEQLGDKEVIVIDFAINNVTQTKLLNEYIKAALPQETHLVLPANTELAEMAKTTRDFSQFQYNNLIFTKTDQMKKIGYLIEMNYRTGKNISYISSGNTIPDDIENANALKIAHMILKG
jgi:flagellar biosynthesis GTPase FlhF